MERKNIRLYIAVSALIVCFLFVFGTFPALQSSAKFARGTTVSSSSTTRSTTTKIGKTKYSDLVILKQKDGTWWACNKHNQQKTDYTGVAPTMENGFWYCYKGKVDKKFTGVAENPFGLWYCKKGHADLDFDGYFVRNSMQIYRINSGAASLYTTDLELSEYGIKNGVYKDGSKEANKIMDLTEHLFRENISKAADHGVVRTKGLDWFKTAIILACALAFLGYLIYHLRKDKKRKEEEGVDDLDLF